MPSAEHQEQPRASENNSGAISDSNTVEQEQLQISEKFRAVDSDVTFKSSDGVLFRLPKLNLAVNAQGFPPPEFSTSDEFVELSEASDVLELLFQFCYPQRRPDLELIEFNVLASLAEAAEKYEMFPAMSMCNIRMRDNIAHNPVGVMCYAAKHGYTDILDATYSLAFKEPLGEIVSKLPPHFILPWMLHYERYNQVLQRAITYYDTWKPRHAEIARQKMVKKRGEIAAKCIPQTKNCLACHILRKLSRGVSALTDLDAVFDFQGSCCGDFTSGLRLWRQAIENDMLEIPPFYTLL